MPNEIGSLMQNAYGGGGGHIAGLGALLGGGNAMGRQNAFARGAYLGGALNEKLAHAALEREKEIATQGMAQTLIDNGIDPQQAHIFAGISAAGRNPNELGQMIESMQKKAIQDRMLGNLDTGTESGLSPAQVVEQNNPLAQIYDPKAEAVNKVEGGVAINPYESGDIGTPTLVGTSEIGAHNAAAAHSMAGAAYESAGIPLRVAQTAEANARTAKVNDSEDPDSPNYGAGKSGRPKELTDREIETLFPNEGDYAHFLGHMKETGESNSLVAARSYFAPGGLGYDKLQQAAAAKVAQSAPGPSIMDRVKGAVAQAWSGGIAKPQTKEDFDALPPGTQFINPADGRTMVKRGQPPAPAGDVSGGTP